MCQNLQVTKSQKELIWYCKESRDFWNGLWTGSCVSTTLIAKQEFPCSSPIEQLIVDISLNSVDFLVLPTKDFLLCIVPCTISVLLTA